VLTFFCGLEVGMLVSCVGMCEQGTVRYGTARYCMARYGAYGTVRHGTVRYGTVWDCLLDVFTFLP
jgi:hypothetical protein